MHRLFLFTDGAYELSSKGVVYRKEDLYTHLASFGGIPLGAIKERLLQQIKESTGLFPPFRDDFCFIAIERR